MPLTLTAKRVGISVIAIGLTALAINVGQSLRNAPQLSGHLILALLGAAGAGTYVALTLTEKDDRENSISIGSAATRADAAPSNLREQVAVRTGEMFVTMPDAEDAANVLAYGASLLDSMPAPRKSIWKSFPLPDFHDLASPDAGADASGLFFSEQPTYLESETDTHVSEEYEQYDSNGQESTGSLPDAEAETEAPEMATSGFNFSRSFPLPTVTDAWDGD